MQWSYDSQVIKSSFKKEYIKVQGKHLACNTSRKIIRKWFLVTTDRMDTCRFEIVHLDD